MAKTCKRGQLMLLDRNNKTEGIFPRFSNNRPSQNRNWFFLKTARLYIFITVDGRQESSRGMTLEEFADLMIGGRNLSRIKS